MVIGLLAGAMLAVAGGTYQGVFRNPLADPYLLGVASGAGLGATFAIIDIGHGTGDADLDAAPGVRRAHGRGDRDVDDRWAVMRSNTATLILAGVAVAALLTSAQTFLQQQSSAQSITLVYMWLLGSLASAGWSSVMLVLALRRGVHRHLRRRRSGA